MKATLRLLWEFLRVVVLHDVVRPAGITLLIWCLVVLGAQEIRRRALELNPCPPMAHESATASPWMHE